MVVHRIGVAVELTMSLQQATAIRAKAPEEGIPLKDIVDSIGGGEVVEVRDIALLVAEPFHRTRRDRRTLVGHQHIAVSSERLLSLRRGGRGVRHLFLAAASEEEREGE